MWKLINNNLKIFIDPFFFAYKQRIEENVLLTKTFKAYFDHLDPSLCDVEFYYPKYAEKVLGSRRTFFPNDDIVNVPEPPAELLTALEIPESLTEVDDDFEKLANLFNESVTLAIENKCIFFLSDFSLPAEKKQELKREHNLQIVSLPELYSKIESFTQGFYNYFKFGNPVYGISSPDVAHMMSDEFIRDVLIPFERLANDGVENDTHKERMRSFVHNRYPDLLISIDQINFFKIQQNIDDMKSGKTHNLMPRFHGFVRYHANYYLYLLYGSVDHLAWIINDIFDFGISDRGKKRKSVGLYKGNKRPHKNRREFFQKIKESDKELYEHIMTDEVQEWIYFLSQVRNQSAHREVFSASPLSISTPESQITDEEIDDILYKDEPPIPEEIEHMVPSEMVQYQKELDRHSYRVSKMKKGLDHFALVRKDGEKYLFDPIARIPIDLERLQTLITKIFSAYQRYRDTELQ